MSPRVMPWSWKLYTDRDTSGTLDAYHQAAVRVPVLPLPPALAVHAQAHARLSEQHRTLFYAYVEELAPSITNASGVTLWRGPVCATVAEAKQLAATACRALLTDALASITNLEPTP